MLKSFRRASKSTVGTAIIGLVGLLIIIGFAAGDISSLSLGNGGLGASTLAKAGSAEVTDRDMAAAMQRRLAQVRQQNPEADYSMLAADFNPLLEALLDQRALQAFARASGISISKRLVDAQIAQIPGVKGLNGQVTAESYQQFLASQRLTDAEVRDLLSGGLLERLLVTPVAASAKVPLGMATPYASMLLERREGEVATVPIQPFAAKINPSEAQIGQYYASNRSRYMIPEQRVLKIARIGPDQVAAVAATPQEIEAYYNAHQELYGSSDLRVIQQAVVPDEAVAKGIAARVRSGQSFDQAAKPAGLGAADVNLGEQSRTQFAEIAGAEVAAQAFSAPAGATIGPIRSALGWHVIRIVSSTRKPGKPLAAARAEIAALITADKRKQAFADLVNKVQDALDGGANFDEAARSSSLQVLTTPPITATGVARSNPGYQFPQELAPALRSGFELAPTDEPVIEQLEGDKGFAMVAPAEVIPAAPAPLASIHEAVRADLIRKQASDQALALARSIAAKASSGTALRDAIKQAGIAIPPVEPASATRLQLSQLGDKVPPPLRLLFSQAQGKAQVAADPQARGFFIVKVDKIIPGNALNQPQLIGQVQAQFAEPVAQEYAEQFIAAVRKAVGIRRNESAIEAERKRITGGSGS